jgi:hypothetical protein
MKIKRFNELNESYDDSNLDLELTVKTPYFAAMKWDHFLLIKFTDGSAYELDGVNHDLRIEDDWKNTMSATLMEEGREFKPLIEDEHLDNVEEIVKEITEWTEKKERGKEVEEILIYWE